MRRRPVLLLLALAAATFALPRRRRLRWPSRRRRKKMWTRATRRAARSLEASVSEVRELLLSTREDRRDLAGNALAGLASAVAVVPEASQFALIAGAHPLVGLGSTVAVGASCAVFGGRPGMVSGASATCALVLKPLVESHGVEAMRVAVFVAGLLQLAVGLLKGGRLVRMVPQPVVLGFVNGLAVKVLRAQVDHFQSGGRRRLCFGPRTRPPSRPGSRGARARTRDASERRERARAAAGSRTARGSRASRCSATARSPR